MATCCGDARQEFQLKMFGFGDISPRRFTRFHFPFPPLLYVIYRIGLALYGLFWLINTALEFSRISMPHVWPVYISNLAYLVLTIYLVMYAMAVSFHVCRRPKYLMRAPPEDEELEALHENSRGCRDGLIPRNSSLRDDEPSRYRKESEKSGRTKPKELQWYFKIIWVFYSILSNCATLVTLVFFLFLWPKIRNDQPLGNMHVQLHAINLVIVALDHVCTSIPVRLLHVLYSVLFGVFYVLFTLILFLAGDNRPIYPVILDWGGNPYISLVSTALLTLIAVPIIHATFFGIFKLKECLSTKIRKCLDERDQKHRASKEPVTVL